MNEDRDQAFEDLTDCVLLHIITRRAISSGPAVTETREAAELAALRLVNVICELPAHERPEDWEPDPGAVTA